MSYNVRTSHKSYNLNTFSKAAVPPRYRWHFAVMKITGMRHLLTRYNTNSHLTLIHRIQYKHSTYGTPRHPNVVYSMLLVPIPPITSQAVDKDVLCRIHQPNSTRAGNLAKLVTTLETTTREI